MKLSWKRENGCIRAKQHVLNAAMCQELSHLCHLFSVCLRGRLGQSIWLVGSRECWLTVLVKCIYVCLFFPLFHSVCMKMQNSPFSQGTNKGNMGTMLVMGKAFIVCLALTKQNCVLVHLGCFNKIPQNGWLRNSRNLFLTFLEAGGLKLGCLHGQVKVLFRTADFLCSHKAEKQGISLIKALISFVRVLPS